MKEMLFSAFTEAPSKLTEAALHSSLCAWIPEQREAAPPWATARILWSRPPGGAPPFPLELLETAFGDFRDAVHDRAKRPSVDAERMA
jgi:hypothetical protein